MIDTLNPDAEFTPFPALIAAHALAHPQAVALQVDDRTLDWHTLHQHMLQVAGAMLASGLAPGDRVALLGAPSLAYAECLFGAIAARACVVPLPLSASAETLRDLLADCEAKLLFIDADAGEAAAAMAAPTAETMAETTAETTAKTAAGRSKPQRILLGPGGTDSEAYLHWRASGNAPQALPQASSEDPFNIIYSSGTTGLPKGIVHLHGMRQRQALRKGFFSPQACTLLATPMYSNTTLVPMLGTLAHGGRCVLMRKFDAGRWLALAAAQRATHTMLVPVQYQRILAHADFDGTDLSALALSQCTGAPTELALKQQIVQRWPGRFLEVYGLTEGGVSFYLDAQQHPGKLATVGRAGADVEAFLIDEAGRRLPNSQYGQAGQHGLTGEVVGRSPFMMAGYYRRPEATAQIRWHDEQGRVYHRSGDIGRFDADGFLTLLDRLKDMIISGGQNIYASDLEAVLLRHESVQDAAVIGVPSAQWGETPLALVVPRAGAQIDAATLRDWVNAQVGKTQRLSAVELRDALPRSALGKLSKKALRAPYWPAG